MVICFRKATIVHLILQLIKSVCLVGLAEGFSLLERFVPPENMIDIRQVILETFTLSCDYLKTKVDMVLSNNFKLTEQSLQNMSRDIQMGMELSHVNREPLPLCSVANQIFKHSVKLGYGDKDPSAIFMRARH